MLKSIILLILLSNIFAKSEDPVKQMDLDKSEHYSQYDYISINGNIVPFQKHKGIGKEEKKNKTFPGKQNIDSNDTVFLDGVKHTRYAVHFPNYSAFKTMEDDFRKLITMVDYKFIYKRDYDWRTWRSVEYSNGSEVMVCYKCHNMGNVGNSTDCGNSGFWVLEDEPRCPYEVFSMRTKDTYCVLNYALMNKTLTDCIQLLDSIDLTSFCDNPIVTSWIFDKMYSKVSARPSIIANGREHFKIKTVYMISSSEVVFKIIDSNNHVIYSKIMRSGNVDFACVKDCGDFNQKNI